MTMQQWTSSMGNPEQVVNENFAAMEAFATYGRNAFTSSGLTWGYYGGRWGGSSVADGTLTLTNTATNYIVANRSTGAISASTATTNWNDTANYGRVYKAVASGGLITSYEDHRMGLYGIHGQPDATGSDTTSVLAVAVGDETTAITVGTAKVTFRVPYNFLISGVRASLTTAQSSGSIFTVDINKNGTSILSTKITIDNTEKTSKTAATAAVLSSSTFTDDDEITIDVDQVGNGTATGLKVYIIGKRTA